MTPRVPHLDLVFLHFQSVKPWRSLIMKGLSLFQRTASQLIWLRYVCQNGGTVSKAYIFYERSLIWLNNLTISPLKVSSSSQLMWLSLCLNKITQMHYAIFVMLWFFFFFLFHQMVFVLFSSVFFICCLKRKVKFLHFLESQINSIQCTLQCVKSKVTEHLPEVPRMTWEIHFTKSEINIYEERRLTHSCCFRSDLTWSEQLLLSSFEEQKRFPSFHKVWSNVEHLH